MVVGTRKMKTYTVIVPTLAQAAKEANSFKENLKFLRQRFGLSQAEMARHLGVLQQTIDYWESGKREPDTYNFMVVNLWAKEIKERSVVSY